MEINQERQGDVLTLGLSGKLDATSVKAFEARILGVIDAGERRLVVDLSRLEYVTSSGLRVFLLAAKRLSNENGRIVFCSLNDSVREVFDIAGFLTVLSVCGSHSEALKTF